MLRFCQRAESLFFRVPGIFSSSHLPTSGFRPKPDESSRFGTKLSRLPALQSDKPSGSSCAFGSQSLQPTKFVRNPCFSSCFGQKQKKLQKHHCSGGFPILPWFTSFLFDDSFNYSRPFFFWQVSHYRKIMIAFGIGHSAPIIVFRIIHFLFWKWRLK